MPLRIPSLLTVVLFASLPILPACTSTRTQPSNPPQRAHAVLPPAPETLPANRKTTPFRASGQSTGLTIFGFIKLISPSKEHARTSLYSNIGRDVSDTTIALQNESVKSSERDFLLFSRPRIQLDAEVVRNSPVELSTEDAAEIPNAPLRRGVPVFPAN